MNDIHDVLEHVLKANNGAGVTVKQIQEIMFMTYGYSYEDTRRAQEALKEKPKSSEAGNNYWVAGLNNATPRRVLLSIGRLAAEKQIDHIISTFALLQNDHPEWDLHVYGDGPEAVPLRIKTQEAGLASRVFFKGSTSEPWAVMAQADAFVMTSAYEGFPNALLEAMAVGLPCVAYDCRNGPRELSRDGIDAILIKQNGQDELHNALHRVMGNPRLRQDLGAQARKSVLVRYSLSSVLAMWDQVFASVGVQR